MLLSSSSERAQLDSDLHVRSHRVPTAI